MVAWFSTLIGSGAARVTALPDFVISRTTGSSMSLRVTVVPTVAPAKTSATLRLAEA